MPSSPCSVFMLRAWSPSWIRMKSSTSKSSRSKWYLPLIILGNDALNKALQYEERSVYYYEAAIAAEHVRAIKFENTDWRQILDYYSFMYQLMPSAQVLLSKATIYLQLEEAEKAKEELDKINREALGQRKYLLHGCYAEYFEKTGHIATAIREMAQAV